MDSDIHDKVLALFQEFVGVRAERLDGARPAEPAISTVTEAIADEYGPDKSRDIAFHLLDWNSNAAFLVAVHLFPERFSAEELQAGIGQFLIHAPNHIHEACRLSDTYVWENFPNDNDNC